MTLSAYGARSIAFRSLTEVSFQIAATTFLTSQWVL
jgi:hypothetical protein